MDGALEGAIEGNREDVNECAGEVCAVGLRIRCHQLDADAVDGVGEVVSC